jgi:imidazolonepropionase-like amidohydrolase
MSAPSTATAISNVRVFDGSGLTPAQTVVIDHGVIVAMGILASADTSIDGQGGTLLPGLIDAHVHLLGPADLEQAAQWGVTTMLDMGSPSMQFTDALRRHPGGSDIRGSGPPASAPGGIQTTRMGFPTSTAVTGPADAPRFVAERVAEGADYLKIIGEDPAAMGPAALDVPTIAALVEAAHQAGLKVIAHASRTASIRMAGEAGVDVLTHAPLDAEIDDHLAAVYVSQGIVSVPTLIMMRMMVAANTSGHLPTHAGAIDYSYARNTVATFRRAGMTILAGTDANMAPMSPAKVPHGESLHEELGLLVEVGLTSTEALRAATDLSAAYFGLADRGVIQPGRRADLVLVEGDPTQDIAATRAIRGVWIAGARIR